MPRNAALWAKVLIAFGVALLAVQLVPRAGDDGGATPPIGTLLLVATVVAIVTTAAFFLVVTRDLGLPVNVAVFAVAWAALVVVVKFVLGPTGFYEVNREVAVTNLVTLEDPVGASLTAAFVLALYVAGYWVLYRLARGRIEAERDSPRVRPRTRTRMIVLWIVGGALLVAAGTGGIAVLLALFLVANGLEYLSFVFTSSVSLLVGLVLGGAATLLSLSFRTASERARVVGDAAVLISLFWVGLAFLALYHALWVVYVLVLTSLWPLRVVVPK